MTTDKKYQRISKPAPGHDEQMQMYSSLAEHLNEIAPSFPMPEPKKFFSSVSTTETTSIFELLIGDIIPGWEINKLDVDVPEILNTLGYPYIRSVTRSSLVSITTRQAVVNLLIIFNWLVRRSKNIRLQIEDIVKPKDQNYDALLEAFGKSGVSDDESKIALLQSLEDESRAIEAENAGLKRQLEDLGYAAELKAKLEDDIREGEKYNQDIMLYKREKEAEVIQCQQDRQRMKQEIEEELRLNHSLETDPVILAHPQPDPAEVEKSTEELKQITHETSKIESKIAALALEKRAELERLEQAHKRDCSVLDAKISHMKQSIRSKTEKCENDELAYEQAAKLDSEYVQVSLKTYAQKAKSILNQVEQMNESTKRIEQVRKEDLQKARRGMVLLCKCK